LGRLVRRQTCGVRNGSYSWSWRIAASPTRRQARSARPPGRDQAFGELRPYVPERGYDRHAVDAYRKRVNRAIAELKVSASCARREAEESTARAKAEAAELVVNASADADRVRDEANELMANARTETEALVAKAKAEAEEIHASARTEAENTIARSHAEAEERFQQLEEELARLRDQAETQMREIQSDTEAVWDERRRLLDDIRRLAGGLGDLADTAAARLQRTESAQPDEETVGDEAGNGTKPPADATKESARPAAAVGATPVGFDENDARESPPVSPGR
jgi:TolA-binding protein